MRYVLYLLAVEEITFKFLGLNLQEPMVFITDQLVALLCGICAYKLNKHSSKTTTYWAVFFLILGISTMVGGFAHLFWQYTGIYLKMVSWFLAGGVTFYAQLATAEMLNDRAKPLLRRMALLELGVFLVCLSIFRDFMVVIVNSIVGLFLIVAMTHIYQYVKLREVGSGWIFFGLLIILATPAIHIAQISPHRWFNHMDLAHLILGIGLYIMYLGGKSIGQQARLADHA